MDENTLWPLLVANFPLVAAFFIALTRKWVYTGTNVQEINAAHDKEIALKDKDIQFREQLRQEALADIFALKAADKEKSEAIKELTTVVNNTLELNERLLDETLGQRWDGSDRRSKPASRAR